MGKEEFSHQIIRASAGSGKTYKLSERYLKLLLEGVPAESILATTFTRKAAGEIQSRILSRLGKGAVSEEGARELSKQLTGDPGAIPRARFQELTIEVVRSINRLRVCTLDAFFMQLAGGYAFELGLSPGWTIVEDGADQSNLGGAIQSTFAQTDGERAHEISRLLFKGESKRSVESQVFELALNALDIYNESTKAAWMILKESAEALDLDLGECMKALEDAELPSNKTKKPTPNGNFLNARNALLAALADKNWKGVLNNGLVKAAMDGSYAYYKIPIEDGLKDAVDAIVEQASNEQNKALGVQLEAIWNVVNAIAHYFDQTKSITGGYRFDDLARKLAGFLQEKPAAFASNIQQGQTSQIDYRLDAKTRHLLLDEFQDASYKQWQIIRPFAERIAASLNANLDVNDPDYAGKLASFFCVGDMKQAIYGWRGGVAEIFEEIERTLKNVSCEGLDMNWRSCPVIIEVVNKLFSNIKNNPVLASVAEGKKSPADLMKVDAVRSAFAKWQELFVQHSFSPNNADKDGFWAIEVAPRVADDRDLVASAQLPVLDPDSEQELEPVDLGYNVVPDDLGHADDASDADDPDNYQNDSVSQRQKELTISYAARRVRNLRDKYPRATIGVLARSNDYLARILRKLKRLGVDASAEGGASIVDAPAVGAMLAVFRLAAHPGDSVDAFCVANVEPIAQEFGLDPNALDQWSCCRVSSYLRACIETEGYGAFAARIRELLRPLCKGADDKAVRQRERLDQLVEFAYSYQAAVPASSLDDFVRAVGEYKVQAPSANPVRLMTIHASKGLEFDIVVLPELDGSSNSDLADVRRVEFIAGRKDPLAPIEAVIKNVSKEERAALPKNFQDYFGAEIKRTVVEALCLLYVAITRPKRMLLAIVNPDKESSGGGTAKLSFANVVRSGLPTRPVISGESGLRHNPQRIYAYGDPNWGAELATPVEEKDLDIDAKDLDVSAEERSVPVFRRVKRKRLLYRRQTPTGADFDDEIGTGAASGYSFWKPREVFIHGKSLHACYEQTEWLDERVPDDLTLESVVAPIVAFDQRLMAQEIAKFRKLCSTNFTQLLMSRAAYLEPGAESSLFFRDAPCAVADAQSKCAEPRFVVCRERNFNVPLKEDLLLNGTFDRLVLLYDGDKLVAADVVDFKTDVKGPGDELFAEYLRQLRRYSLAVEKMFGLPPEKISLRLAFVALGRVVNARVDKKPDFDAQAPQY